MLILLLRLGFEGLALVVGLGWDLLFGREEDEDDDGSLEEEEEWVVAVIPDLLLLLG